MAFTTVPAADIIWQVIVTDELTDKVYESTVVHGQFLHTNPFGRIFARPSRTLLSVDEIPYSKSMVEDFLHLLECIGMLDQQPIADVLLDLLSYPGIVDTYMLYWSRPIDISIVRLYRRIELSHWICIVVRPSWLASLNTSDTCRHWWQTQHLESMNV